MVHGFTHSSNLNDTLQADLESFLAGIYTIGNYIIDTTAPTTQLRRTSRTK
jgi:hypothetical protein